MWELGEKVGIRFEIASYYIVRADLKFFILLPQPSVYWDYMQIPFLTTCFG